MSNLRNQPRALTPSCARMPQDSKAVFLISVKVSGGVLKINSNAVDVQ